MTEHPLPETIPRFATPSAEQIVASHARVEVGKQALMGTVITEVQALNPYEALALEQLEQVRTNIAASVADGVRRYDMDEILRTTVNLGNVQRELERRDPSRRKGPERGMRDGVVHITQHEESTIDALAKGLAGVDGADRLTAGIAQAYWAKYSEARNDEEKLQVSEANELLTKVAAKLDTMGLKQQNPYSTYTNEQLTTLIDNFKRTIPEIKAAGKDASDMIANLQKAGQVVMNRQS